MNSFFQMMSDRAILTFVGLWAVAKSQREYLRLIKFQLPYFAFPIRVAVPRLANEKYLWRKLFDHNPDFVTVTCKHGAKDWVDERVSGVTMPKTLWVGTNAYDIPDTVRAQPYYLKACHGCQMNIPVLSPPDDFAAVAEKANGFLEKDHGSRRRQWAYKDVPRQLIAEEAVLSEGGLIEIKCFTYGARIEQFLLLRRGPPALGSRWERMPDGTFERSSIQTTVSDTVDDAPLPAVTDRALQIASELGAYFDHIRVDFLSDGKDLYLGELTVYHDAGRAYRQGHYAEAPANRSWDLRKSWFLTTPQTGWRKHYAAALLRQLDRQAATAPAPQAAVVDPV